MSYITTYPASSHDTIRFIISAFDPFAGEDLTQRQPYELLDYIVGTQNAYIDLGLVATGATHINCEFIWTSQYSYNFLFGSGTAYNSASFEFYNSSSATTFQSNYNGSYAPSGNFTAGQRLELDKNRGVTTIKDVATGNVIGSQSLAESSFTAGSNMQLFRINRDNCYTSWPQVLYYFHMWDNDKPRRFLIPVRRVSDGAVGLLDISPYLIALDDPTYAQSIGLVPHMNYAGAGKFYGSANGALISAGPRTTQYSLTQKMEHLLQSMDCFIDEDDTRQPLKYVTTDITSHKYYQIEPWFQPTFSQNTYEYDIVGRTTKKIYRAKFELTASHANQAPWYAFNKSLAANNCWWTNHGQTSVSNPCWLNFNSNVKFKFDHITMMNENTSPENFKHGYVQASNDGINYTNIAEFTGTNTASYVTHVQIEHPDFYYNYRLYFDDAYSTAGISIQLINFEGWGRVIKEAREDEPHDLSVEYTTFEIDPEPDYTFYKYKELNHTAIVNTMILQSYFIFNIQVPIGEPRYTVRCTYRDGWVIYATDSHDSHHTYSHTIRREEEINVTWFAPYSVRFGVDSTGSLTITVDYPNSINIIENDNDNCNIQLFSHVKPVVSTIEDYDYSVKNPLTFRTHFH